MRQRTKVSIIISILLTDVFRKLKLVVGIMSKWLGRFNGASGKGSVGIENYYCLIDGFWGWEGINAIKLS